MTFEVMLKIALKSKGKKCWVISSYVDKCDMLVSTADEKWLNVSFFFFVSPFTTILTLLTNRQKQREEGAGSTNLCFWESSGHHSLGSFLFPPPTGDSLFLLYTFTHESSSMNVVAFRNGRVLDVVCWMGVWVCCATVPMASPRFSLNWLPGWQVLLRFASGESFTSESYGEGLGETTDVETENTLRTFSVDLIIERTEWKIYFVFFFALV